MTIETKVDKLAGLVNEMQARNEEVLAKSDESNSELKGSIDKIKADIVAVMDAQQQEKKELAASKHDLELIQKQILDGLKGGDNQVIELTKKYDSALARYYRKGSAIDESIVQEVCEDIARKGTFGVDEERVNREAKDLAAGSGPDGGFFLTSDRSSKISKRMFETSPLRAVANVVTTTSDMYEIILDDDEPAAGWVGEVTARPKTDSSQIGMVKIPIHEIYAMPKATQKMLDDAGFDIAAWHQGKVERKFGRIENTSFVTGDGASKPKGFLSYSAWTTAATYERDKVEQVTGAGSGVIAGDDLIKVAGALNEDYHAGASWAVSRSVFYTNILTLKASTSGEYLINPRVIAEGGEMMLLGKPVNFFSDMPAVAASSLSVAIADWKEFYTIVDRMGIRVIRDPYSAKPYVLFYTTKRVGGAVSNFDAGKILKTKA